MAKRSIVTQLRIHLLETTLLLIRLVILAMLKVEVNEDLAFHLPHNLFSMSLSNARERISKVSKNKLKLTLTLHDKQMLNNCNSYVNSNCYSNRLINDF